MSIEQTKKIQELEKRVTALESCLKLLISEKQEAKTNTLTLPEKRKSA